ncbi:MAG: glycosyltransferase, partial [Pseudomonadota bacterium]
VATDDPEGQEVFESLLEHKNERIHILTVEDSALVNALQRHAAVVLQKSLREGFGLTITEAMWKGAAVIGGNCGGIRHQIEDGVNGYLVSSIDDAAKRIVALVKDAGQRAALGKRARETVRDHFLLTRMVEQELDLFSAFEPNFRLNHRRLSGQAAVAPISTTSHGHTP